MSSQWGQSLPRPPALTLGPAGRPRPGLAVLPQQGCPIRPPHPPVAKTLWETKLPARGGHFKITCRSSLKTSLSWQIKETRGLQCA